MSDQRILITGVAGFIGFHLARSLLEENIEILGLDSMNNYYDPILKLNRLEILTEYKNFKFLKIDISDRERLTKAFKQFKPDKVVNLAAQAGVRYSLINPYAYVDTNLVGFLNVIELCRDCEVGGLIYASSSSVYGANKSMPFKVEDKTDTPVSLYAATKKANELIAHSYSYLFGMHTTGLRFFTVYGPWGRPDMAMYIFTDKIFKGEPLPVYNSGRMKRDFTFISDIVNGIRSALNKNYTFEIFNLGNNVSEELMKMISLIEENIGIKAIIEYMPMQPGDVIESFADIKKSQQMLEYMPKINIDQGIKEFINWYREYNKK